MEKMKSFDLKKLRMINFKNVEDSSISFVEKDEIIKVLGLYGQNGSGKSAVVEAFSILKCVVLGLELPSDLIYYIKSGKNKAMLEFLFTCFSEDVLCIVEIENENGKVLTNLRFECNDLEKCKKNLQDFCHFFLCIISSRLKNEQNFENIVLFSAADENLQKIEINLNEDFPKDKYDVKDIIGDLIKINNLMGKILPDFSLSIADYGDSFGLVSDVGDGSIPFRLESYGTKKLFALCNALLSVYNNEESVVVIDEIDSGIFEYLLGEMVKIIYEGARGQLIFTSHNMRILEVLKGENVLFTTNNPKNRYLRLKNIKGKNLRDFYYRTILLGGASETLYLDASEFEIERALRNEKH